MQLYSTKSMTLTAAPLTMLGSDKWMVECVVKLPENDGQSEAMFTMIVTCADPDNLKAIALHAVGATASSTQMYLLGITMAETLKQHFELLDNLFLSTPASIMAETLMEESSESDTEEVAANNIPEPVIEKKKVTRRPWTRNENKQLLQWYFEKVPYEEIASQLGRTVASCRIQASVLLRQR